VPRGTQGNVRRSAAFVYEGLTRYAQVFQPVRLAANFVTPSARCNWPDAPLHPQPATLAGYHTDWVWAAPLSLATTQGMFSLPGGTKMFQFPPCPLTGL
jgi:hypothetical protein